MPRNNHQIVLAGRHAATAAAACVLALIATACSSSSKPSSGNSGGTSTGTYLLYYITTVTGTGGSYDSLNSEFNASVKAVNARGGINGRQLDVVTCDTKATDNGAAVCGQKAAAAHPFMVIAPALQDAFFPYLEKAHIPVLNGGGTVHGNSSPVSFINNDAILAASAGLVAALHSVGCKSVEAIIGTGSLAALNATLTDGMKKEATNLGVNFTGAISIPESVPDVSAYVAQAISKGAQCLIAEDVIATQKLSLIKALVPLAQAGKFDKVALPTSSFDPSIVNAVAPAMTALGSRAVPVTLSEPPTATANPTVKQWVADQTKYGAHPTFEYESAEYWALLQLAVQTGKAIAPDVSGPRALAYLNSLTKWWPGISPAVDFSKPVAGNPFGARIFGSWVAVSKWTGGTTWPRAGPFVSVLTGHTNPNTTGECPCS